MPRIVDETQVPANGSRAGDDRVATPAKKRIEMSEMTDSDRVAEQTRIRRALLVNGYSPFPCRGKSGQLKGWQHIRATGALIDEWAGQLRWVSTAVHAGVGGLVGIDVDIDDAGVLDDFIARVPADLWARLQDAPVRRGGGVKEMWLVRLAEGEEPRRFRETTGKWGDPESGEDDTDHKLEVWPKAHKLLALYGARTVEGRDVTSEYTWVDGRGPDTVALRDLPVVTNADIGVLLDCAVAAMKAAGWDRLDVADVEGSDSDKVFDLKDDMTFRTRDHGEVDLAGLTELCQAVGDVRLYSWLPGKRRRADRCHAKLNDHDGLLQIYDYDTGKLHRAAEADGAYARQVSETVRGTLSALGSRLSQRVSRSGAVASGEVGGGAGGAPGAEGGEGLDRLSELLASVPPEKRLFGGAASVGGSVDDAEVTAADGAAAFDAAMESLLGGWAWVTMGAGFAAPIGGTADQMMTLGGLRNTMAPWCKIVKEKKTEIEVNPADVWIKHPARQMVAGHRLIPWTTDRVTTDEMGLTWINTYQPPRHGGVVGDEIEAGRAVRAWVRFLEHLIPDERERAWFEMWLAAKVQKPWLPNCGVVMVAETHGTGRGTLFDMLGAVMGDRHVKPVSSTELMGGGGQGQYTDWLADALLVTCDELLAGNDAGGAMEWKRREVYERLKTYVDPRARRVRIVRKGLPGYDTEVFASFLMATNNPNALPLAEQDRRFAVIRNTDVKLVDAAGGGLHKDVTAWRGEDSRFVEAFGAAVWHRLAGVAVDWGLLRDAPEWMAGRADMLAANEGDLEEIVSNVLSDVPGDFLLGEHLRMRLKVALEAGGMEHELKNWWVRAQDMLARRNGSGWRRMARRQDVQPRSAGRKFVTVYYRVDGAGEGAWGKATPEERVGLWKRGSDLNDKLSRLDAKVRERGLKVLDGKAEGPA